MLHPTKKEVKSCFPYKAMSKFYELRDFPLFTGCAIEEFLQQTSNRISTYKKDDLIALQGAPCLSLMLLCTGELSARMVNDEGKEIIIERLNAPEVLAPAFLYSSENFFPVTLKAETEVRIWTLSREGFLDLMTTDKNVLRNFLQHISDRSVFLSKKLNEFALQNLNERIVNYLKRHGQIQNIQEVASIIGVARPSLSRAISVLINEGVIEKEENRYKLKNE